MVGVCRCGWQAAAPKSLDQSEENDDGSGSNTSSEEEEEEEAGGDKTQGYNPNDYANLQVSGEIKELFQYIQVPASSLCKT